MNVPLCLSLCHTLLYLQAKRAAREAARGFDVEAASQALAGLVEGGGDMLAFQPTGKHGQVRGRL